jgi:hypothetical protein
MRSNIRLSKQWTPTSQDDAPLRNPRVVNVGSDALDAELAAAVARGAPTRIVGRTPDNIGMQAYRDLFCAARHPLIVQIDDDVVCISRGIAERAQRLFKQFPAVRRHATIMSFAASIRRRKVGCDSGLHAAGERFRYRATTSLYAAYMTTR